MLRPTTSRTPLTPIIQSTSALPLGLLISPLSPSPPPRLTPPSASILSESARASHLAAAATTASAVPRCTSCGGYISARCTMNARYWRCALCGTKNELEARYASTVISGENEAIELVPEISRDVYDVAVLEGGEAVPPTAYIFVVEGGGSAEYLDAMRMAVKKGLDVIEGESLVGVMLYDDYLSFVDVRDVPVLRRMAVEDGDCDVATVFTPDQWLRGSGRTIAEKIMHTLGKVEAKERGCKAKRGLASAVKKTLDMVERARLLAARVVVIAAGMTNWGEGVVEGGGEGGKDRFAKMATNFYANLGVRASMLGAMVDVYMVSGVPVDVASLAPLAQISGGRLILYEGGGGLEKDVWQHLNDPAVVRGMLRVRCSGELRVKDVFGCGVYRDAQVNDVFRLSCHGHTSTLAAELAFRDDDGFDGASMMPCVQVAFRGVFLEPGMLPQRVLRVETQCYPLSSSKTVLRREADANAVMTLMFHRALAKADEGGIGEARMLLFDWLASLLAKTAVEDEGGEMTIDATMSKLPSLKTIPRLVFGLIRSLLFRQEAVSPDVRAAIRCIWEDLSPELLAAAAYPRLWSFLNAEEKSIKELALSSAAVKQSGHALFLLDAFSDVVIYYAASMEQDVPFPPPESSAIMRFRAACIRDRPVAPKCVVCREGTAKDRLFKGFLIEDPVPGAAAQSFEAFLGGVCDEAMEILQSGE